ncbi:MAG: hypothetical protein QW076_00555 [Candidatus Anstonellales archaeon]
MLNFVMNFYAMLGIIPVSDLELLVADPLSVSAMLAIGIFVLIISLTFSALAYMLGRITSNDKMMAFAKTEFFQSILSVLLVMILVLFITSFNVVFEAFINSLNIGTLYPGICDLSSPNGYLFRNYVYDVSPTKYAYMEAMKAVVTPVTGTDIAMFFASVASGAIGYLFVGVKYLMLFFMNFLGNISGASSILDKLSIYSVYYYPRPEGGIKNPVTGNPYPFPCHFAVANLYFDTISWNIMYYFQDMIAVYDKYAVLSTVSLSIEAKNAASPYIGMNPTAFLEYIATSIRDGVDILGKLLNVTKLLQNFLLIIHIGIFPIGLLLGFILRSFFLTRRIGGLILSISVGLYIFYPLVFSFLFLIFSYVAEHKTVQAYAIGNQAALLMTYLTTNGIKPTFKLKEGTLFGDTHPLFFFLVPGLLLSVTFGFCNILDDITDFFTSKVGGNTGIGKIFSGLRTGLLKLGILLSNLDPLVVGAKAVLAAAIVGMALIGVSMQFLLLKKIYLDFANIEPPLFIPGGIAEQVGIYILYAGILTFFGVLATVVFIKNFSPLLGGDKDIAGLARII